MADEIERKFLVPGDAWRAAADMGCRIEQAYLALTDVVSIRIRIRDTAAATLTIKSRAVALRRQEFEFPIPVHEAAELIMLRTGSLIEKTRYKVPCRDLVWEIDVFQGANAGLVIAEIELEHEDQAFERPAWLGEEITGVERYYNASLALAPFGTVAPIARG
ncbi:MAG: CYTH domain-containing protein [Sphingomonadales bacterium]|nr:CYTH domain-containing protein [Sphingomonadales bacterium]